jgi:hypothetical protein
MAAYTGLNQIGYLLVSLNTPSRIQCFVSAFSSLSCMYIAIATMDSGKVDQSWRRPCCHLSCKHVTDNYRAVCKQPSMKIRRGRPHRRWFVAILRIVGEYWYHIAELITLSCLACSLNSRRLYHVMINGELGVLKHALLFQNFGILSNFFKFLLLGRVQLCF